MNDAKLKASTDEELAAWYHNASTTGACCGGHGKAYENEARVRRYVTEMKVRSMPVPEWKQGFFNGPGAY